MQLLPFTFSPASSEQGTCLTSSDPDVSPVREETPLSLVGLWLLGGEAAGEMLKPSSGLWP